MNQSQTYQGNPCGVYPDISSLTRSRVIPNSVTCIKRSTPSKDHIIWYQSFDSCYRFYPIQLFFFVICLRFVFCCYLCSCSCSCLCLVAFLFALLFVFLFSFLFLLRSCSFFFQILCQKFYLNYVSNSVANYVWGQFGLLEEFWG